MEQTKLTVRVDRRWVEPAKAYAARHRTSLSRLISEYLRLLALPEDEEEEAPIVARLKGILPSDVDRSEHARYLEEKHAGS